MKPKFPFRHFHTCIACGDRVECYGYWRTRSSRGTHCDVWRSHDTRMCEVCEEAGATADRPEPHDPLADEGQSDARELARDRP
jgi:hypothetical protein